MMETSTIRKISVSDLIGRPLNSVEKRWAPSELFIAGSMKIPLEGIRIAVIGTREPSQEGLEMTRRLVVELVKKDWVVVSGLARGIDTAAHKTALENGGRTIAVLGTPIDRYYPPENRTLQEEIREKGLLISQFPVGAPIQRKNFVMRNRTMALVSHACVITDALERSGVVSQGWETLRLARLLFIVKRLDKLRWVSDMFRYGAILFEDIEEVLEVVEELSSPTELLEIDKDVWERLPSTPNY
ncbi:MAG: DNA-processing protein DprA [Thermoplasmata archaeon]